MSIVSAVRRLTSAATVFFGGHGAVSQLARQRAVCRQVLYREADATLQQVEGSTDRQRLQNLHQDIAHLRRRVAELEARLRQAVVLDADRQARFAATAQAEGVSLPVARRLLGVFLGPRTPS